MNHNWNTDLAWKKMHARLEGEGQLEMQKRGGRAIRPMLLLRIAASILILTTGTLALRYALSDRGEAVLMEFHAESDLQEVKLPDGSQVFLNKGSKLSYTADFKTKRSLKLQGEAFFNVLADAAHPFTVSCCSSQVRVLGTSFNVKTDGRHSMEVLVKSGKVELMLNDTEQGIMLLPGEMGSNKRGLLTKGSKAEPNYLSWKTKEFIFADSDLAEVVRVLEQAYHVEIRVDAAITSGKHLTSTYSHLDIDSIVETIATAFDLNVTKVKKGYLLQY